MEELKLLIEMVSDLPAMALWVILGYFLYKMAIVGSVYGVIRYGFNKVKEIVEVRQRAKVDSISESKRSERVDTKIKGMTIISDGTYENVIHALTLIKTRKGSYNSRYLHDDDADWLLSAIQDKLEQEREKE